MQTGHSERVWKLSLLENSCFCLLYRIRFKGIINQSIICHVRDYFCPFLMSLSCIYCCCYYCCCLKLTHERCMNEILYERWDMGCTWCYSGPILKSLKIKFCRLFARSLHLLVSLSECLCVPCPYVGRRVCMTTLLTSCFACLSVGMFVYVFCFVLNAHTHRDLERKE